MNISTVHAWLYAVISATYVALELAGAMRAWHESTEVDAWLNIMGQVYKLYVGLILTVVFFPWNKSHVQLSATTRNVAFSAGCILFLSGAARAMIDFVAARLRLRV